MTPEPQSRPVVTVKFDPEASWGKQTMPNYSLLFARTEQDADDSALIDWKWDKVGELGHHEYRRPDTGERIRFVSDNPHSMQNLRWNTRIYCGRNWVARTDANMIMACIGQGFFREIDPELPPPRIRSHRETALMEIKRSLDRLEKS